MTTKTHKIHIRSKNKDVVLTGHNCEVLIDDVVLTGVKRVSFEIDSNSIGKVTFEMLGRIEIEGKVEAIVSDRCPACYTPAYIEPIDKFTVCTKCELILKRKEK